MTFKWIGSLITLLITASTLYGVDKDLPEAMQKIMKQDKYKHSLWGLYAKDLQTGAVLYDYNSNLLFSPASTTKNFSVSALLHAYGDDYRFKTPVYAVGKIQNQQLDGDLVLVGQGDLTFGGRQPNANTIAYTKMDHIYANDIPGAILTPEDPLTAINQLAKDVKQKGITQINGNIEIDDRLFETTHKRGLTLSPIIINENLIDIVLNPTSVSREANLTWRPMVPGYKINNQVKTVDKGEPLDITVSSDDDGRNITIKGTIPLGQHDVVRNSPIINAKEFAIAAFTQALKKEGVTIKPKSKETSLPTSYEGLTPIAVWTSPPLYEYAKLILKVSHNEGADLVALLLAIKKGKKTFDEGMLLLGDFVINEVKVTPDNFVFIDAAGGNDNRLTPQAEVVLLEYVHKLKPEQFQHFFDALPIMGVDGSLEDFGKNIPGMGKVRAKPGTGVSYDLAQKKFFLSTQTLAGYVEGKNGHLIVYMLGVMNATMPTVEDIFPIFEDVSMISNQIYLNSSK